MTYTAAIQMLWLHVLHLYIQVKRLSLSTCLTLDVELSPQGLCVVNNFKGVHSAAAKQKTEEYRGLPLMTFPRVESPLETLSAQVARNT